MDTKKGDSLTDAVESRMEGLFEKNGDLPESKQDAGTSAAPLIHNLKATVLSIEWEISDGVLTDLIEESVRLEETYRDDKDLLLFLQLLGSIGKYIKKRKVNAHPDAIKLLNSVYNSLEKVLLSRDITEEEKRQILLIQVEEFKKLKERIARRKTDADKGKTVQPPEKTKPIISTDSMEHGKTEKIKGTLPDDINSMTPQEVLTVVLTEIKHLIRTEFNALREDLEK
ncbi:MAG: hypothetical protein JRI61_01475 [Deltaproteobacteria bacterium]|nr:hypothetical protein [Deltaproteobacteria bacterium]